MNLTIGSKGTAWWTNSNQQMQGACEIVKVNKQTLRVRLLEPVSASIGTWPIGHELVLPVNGSWYNHYQPAPKADGHCCIGSGCEMCVR